MQVHLNRADVEEACANHVKGVLAIQVQSNGQVWRPEIVEVTLHSSGQGATVQIAWDDHDKQEPELDTTALGDRPDAE